MNKLKYFIIIMILSVISHILQTRSVEAYSINIDYGRPRGAPDAGYPGAASQPGVWNEVTSTSNTSIFDTTGALTGVTITTQAGNFTGTYTATSTTSPEKLLEDNIFSSIGVLWSTKFANLAAGTYDIYYYAPSHTGFGTGPVGLTTELGGSIFNVDIIGGEATDSLVEGTHYGVYQDYVHDGTGYLELYSASTSGTRGLAGIQIVDVTVPEPTTIALLGIGLAGLVGGSVRRRFKRVRK